MAFSKTRISTEIEIEAPATKVWEALVDTEAYSIWNPFIRSIRGELEIGRQIEATIQLANSAPMNFKPTIVAATKYKELRWVGKLGVKGIFDGEHFFILDETSSGKTVFRHGEVFSGLLSRLLLLLIGDKTKQGFGAMNIALKKKVEGKPLEKGQTFAL